MAIIGFGQSDGTLELELILKAVLFDLDGTLIDTRNLILDSFRYAYTTVLGPESLPPDEKLLSLIGIPLKTQMEMIAPDKSEELFKAYIENNVRVQDDLMREFDGLEEALLSLLTFGMRMGVVTSKRNEPALYGLKFMGLNNYFQLVLGADDTEEHKPKPGPLLEAARRMDLEVSDCAYVGDSPYDMQSAKSAGMFAVGVLWGMFTKDALLEAGADKIVAKPKDLPALFAQGQYCKH